MRLFQHPISSSARRVAMTIALLGIDVEMIDVNLMSEDDRRRLVELNPNSKIPVLQDGDFVLWESHAIMQYLCDRTPGQSLLPADPRQRAEVNRWMFWASHHWQPTMSIYTWENFWKRIVINADPDPAMLAHGDEELNQFGAVLDAHLAARQWVAGDQVTLADLALASPLMYKDKGTIPLERFPHVVAWLARVQALPCWQATEASF